MTTEQHLAALQRNFSAEEFARYMALPEFKRGEMVVHCPMVCNEKGEADPLVNVNGCGSTDVKFDGEVYDCFACGIFFSDYAAHPPHRRRCEDTDYSDAEVNMKEPLWARFGDADDYHEVGGVIELRDELRDRRIKGPFTFANKLGLSCPGYRGQNYISLYFGTDAGTPTRGLTTQELRTVNGFNLE